MTVAYDGSGFHGFAENPGVATVGGTLRRSLEQILGHSVELTCAGRTDRGVHAQGQVVTFDAEAGGLDVDALARGVTHICEPDVVVRDAAVVDPAFDARRSARSRTYRYSVLNRPVPDPFRAATTWHVESPLDLRLLTLACDPLIGEHDFTSFCRAVRTPPGVEPRSLVRRVLDARWDRVDDDVVRFEITASSFCHQMVRSLVGTLVDAGLGRRTPGDVTGILRARDRHAAGQLAPPRGLCLWSVAYDGWSS